MPNFWESDHTFPHTWEKVTSGVWQKYPNPYSPQVAAVDCIHSVVEEGVLKRKRVISSNWELPGWIQSLLPSNCTVVEKTEVDPSNKKFVMRSKNITGSNILQVEETCTYTPHPEDPNQTLLQQEAKVSVFGISFTDRLEKMVVNKISSQADKGRIALDHVINSIFHPERLGEQSS
eukprot:Nk52_evm18s367 gene=Nk52_evmTU18s367